MSKVIVVGGGLAGFAAANTILERGGNVILLDKSPFCGGNSTKATSGVSGSGTQVQERLHIDDTNCKFLEDVVRRGSERPELARALCENSGSSIDWLVKEFGLEISLVERLPGHSIARTHRGKKRFTGMAATFAMMEKLERVQEKNPERCRIVNRACVVRLLLHEADANRVIGCEYEREGERFQERGPVILCTGGFGADYTVDSLLRKHRPDLFHFPSNNGAHCTGDGIKMGQSIGANSIDMHLIQVHPMGVVDPGAADAKIKLLAEASLRDAGGILLDCEGARFCNELGRRDDMNNAMWERNKAPYRLILNQKAYSAAQSVCDRYEGRGLMRRFTSGAEIAREIGIGTSVLEKTLDEYNLSANMETPDKFGKRLFNSVPFTMQDSFHVAIVTPVIHYCMGGLEIDRDGSVLSKENSTPIRGLYAAGEVTGGVHGNNRLAGNSLLECLVFGRLTGEAATKYLTDMYRLEPDLSKIVIASPQAPRTLSIAKLPLYSPQQVAEHNTRSDCWIVVNGQVLDVTNFVSQHPGGDLALMRYAGQDATEDFNNMHPIDAVIKYAPHTIIGNLFPTPPRMPGKL